MADIDGNSSSLAAQLQAQLLSGRGVPPRPQPIRTDIADSGASGSEENRQRFLPDDTGGRQVTTPAGPRLDRALSSEDDLGDARQRVNTLLTRESPFGRTSSAGQQRDAAPSQPGQIVDIRV